MNILDWARSPTVLVPVVRKGDTLVDWLDVYSRPAQAQEREKSKDSEYAVIAPLARKHMTKTALAGLEAVNRLLDRRGMKVLELNTRLSDICVDTERLLPNAVEDHSSDLGIGLALLLGLRATQDNVGVLAATGQLGTFVETLNDLPVKPVGDTEAKLKALLALKKQGGGVADALTLVFTPKETDAGTPVAELDVVAELKQFPGVRVHPVGSFGEAARILGIRPRFPWPRVFRVVGPVLAAGLLVAMIGSAARFLTRPATLEFLPGENSARAEPYLVCLDERLPARPHPLATTGTQTTLPANGELAWKVRVGQPDEAESWVYRALASIGYDARYHLATVLIGETTGVLSRTVSLPDHSERETAPARANPGGVWRYHIGLDGTEERSVLVLLASRLNKIDEAALTRALRDELKRQREQGEVDLKTMGHFLEKQADVKSLSFPFQATGKDPLCAGD